MRWLQLAEVLELHRRLIDQSGGMAGIRDLGLLEHPLDGPDQLQLQGGHQLATHLG
jgi:death-on-curing protein